MTDCTKIQERIASSEPLRPSEQSHLSSCEACSRVAQTYAELELSLEALAEPVPDGFADRVMSRIAELPMTRSRRWFDARWVEFALTNVALACAVVNAVRFLAGVLIPSVSLGGAP